MKNEKCVNQIFFIIAICGSLLLQWPSLANGQTISISDSVISEGQSATMIFSVILTGATDVPVTVDCETRDGSATVADGDYEAAADTLTFPPSTETSQSQLFAVVVFDDSDEEIETASDTGSLGEDFFVDLSNAQNATITDGTARGFINNDDGGGCNLIR